MIGDRRVVMAFAFMVASLVLLLYVDDSLRDVGDEHPELVLMGVRERTGSIVTDEILSQTINEACEVWRHAEATNASDVEVADALLETAGTIEAATDLAVILDAVRDVGACHE